MSKHEGEGYPTRLSAFVIGLAICLDDRLHARQALLELAADHLVAVHEQAERLANEVILAEHAPRHDSLTAFGLEGEFRGVGRFEGLFEFELDLNQLIRTALDNRLSARADLVVAGPCEGCAGS